MVGFENIETSVSLFGALADGSRVRLLALLSEEELTVAELTQITSLTQSRISSHLARLRDAGLLRDRRDGASNYYALSAAMPEQARRVWENLRASLDDPLLAEDRRRLAELLDRRARTDAAGSALVGEMERHYSPGRTWETTARGLLGFAPLGRVLDLCCGDGVIAELIAPHASGLDCLDINEKKVRTAARRLAQYSQARAHRGDMHQLPFAAGSFDQVLFFNALTYSEDPPRALSEVRRVLKPRGTLSLVCLHRHSDPILRTEYHHIHPGFEVEALRRMLQDADFDVRQCRICSRERRPPHFEVISSFATPSESAT